MSLVYVFAASTMEAQPVRRIGVHSDSNAILRCGPNDVVLITGGMGPINARIKADAALQSSAGVTPDAVLSIGLCGGLTALLPEGRIVGYTECRSTQAGKPLLRCSEKLIDSMATLLKSSNIVCDRVEAITSPEIATTPPQRMALANLGGAVVDMESYLILEAAATARVPAAVLRVVSDSVDRVLPDFNRALDQNGAIDGRKALRVAMGSPVRTAKLFAANRRAMQLLGKALEIVLKNRCFS
jgi:nucleoside phosphorylase